jgi:hypothetical protein
VTFLRKVERQNRSEECVGNLDEDARTISSVHLGTSRATVVHIAKRA